MRTLRLVALSDDGKSLVLAAEGADGAEGERFELPVDDRVRAAARGDARRLTQIDVDAGVELPPRVIQARIRAGETPEQVAAASGTRVERIMRFASPVLQERQRVAEQAREARVRLTEGAPGGELHRFMDERLRLIDSDIGDVAWDAHRTHDGSWQVTGAWRAGDKSGLTRWTFDLPTRTVTPADAATMDFAEGTRLVRVVPDVPAGLAAPTPRPRTVSVVRDDDEPVVHDTVTPDVLPADLLGHDDGELVRDVHPASGSPADERSIDALLDEVADHDTVVLGRSGADGDDGEDPRARIPAWEDIVFGVRRHR
ncbi:septation protein SepH [Blastococcus brunescens]|uniref:Septation protein SepH n=1 Tax=Blastococcus brunescens TaxID=1564165 RepID=A0ABZ1B4H8_9ACTN|nr:septation protein SepH [Blastococcus sp. BMG 8361]WRL64636.1 septation protein SepH [Blastococcus sp. BMG 8361]